MKEAVYNKKFGFVRLINSVNIVTAVTDFKDFISNLSGDYIDNMENESMFQKIIHKHIDGSCFSASSENIDVYGLTLRHWDEEWFTKTYSLLRMSGKYS